MSKTRIEWADKLKKRFWSYVEKTDNCWLWDAGTFSNGYGQFRVGKKKMKAHRVAYIFTEGEIPEGLILCHKCDNRLCVNPDHLFLGSNGDNAEDRHKKKRDARGNNHGMYTNPEKRCPGENNGSAKLKWEHVRRIRQLSKEGLSRSKLAVVFGISKSQIRNIVTHKCWKESCNANQNSVV